MKTLPRLLLSLSLCAAVLPARGQGAPPPPAAAGFHAQELPLLMRSDLSTEERERLREEARRRREAWQQMSPEERHQLRRDIRDAGQALYPRREHRPRD